MYVTQIAAVLAHGKCHESPPSLRTSGQVERSYEVSEEGIKCPQGVAQPHLRSDLLADELCGDIHVRIVGTKKMGLQQHTISANGTYNEGAYTLFRTLGP
jgi:hypothetical protein